MVEGDIFKEILVDSYIYYLYKLNYDETLELFHSNYFTLTDEKRVHDE